MRVLSLLLLMWTSAWAESPLLDLKVGHMTHGEVQVHGLQVQADVGRERTALRIRIDKLEAPELAKPLSQIDIGCPNGQLQWPALRCAKASITVADSPWGAQAILADLDWQSFEDWSLAFQQLRYAGDRLSGDIKMQLGRWQAQLRANAIELAQSADIGNLLAKHGITEISGLAGGRVQLAGNNEQLQRLDLFVGLRDLTYSDMAGLQAAERLSARLSLSAQREGTSWRGGVQLNSLGGEWFSDPVFVDYAAQPLQLIIDGQWQEASKRLKVKKLLGTLGKGLQVQGAGEWTLDSWQPESGEVRVDSRQLDTLYRTLLQPLAIGTRADALDMSGLAGLHLRWRYGALNALDVALQQLDFADQNDAFGGNAVQGHLHWRAVGDAPNSALQWQGLNLGKLLFGTAHLQVNLSGSHAYLVQPLAVPFHGGELQLNEFTLLAVDDDWHAGMRAALKDVQLESLSTALDWPLMSGSLNGSLPRARYANDRLDVQGDIVIQAFGGELRLQEIALSELRSVAPAMQGEVELTGLDLAKLTKTFSLGKIQGGLQGEVRNMRLVGWQPDRFDAHVFTPSKDPLPHRISQRALQDLTELGSGLSGIVSGSFLRFFDTFAYDRVELKVSQRGDRATLDGAPHPEGGFYLVRGAGIPRIDVVGRNREIAWSDLIKRLKTMRLEGLQMQ